MFDHKSETKEPLWIQVLAIHSQNTISLFHFLRRNGNHPPWRYLVLKAKPKNSHCPQSTCFSPGHPAEKNAWGTAYGQHAVFPLIWQGDTMAQILAKSEFSPRRQLETTAKVNSGLEQGLMVPSEPSSLPHSSGSSLQRPTYWQTTHTHTDTHTPKGRSLLTMNVGSEKNGRWKGDDSPSRWVGLPSPCGLGGKSGGDTTSSVRRRSQPDEHPGAWREATTGKCFFVSVVFWLRLVTWGSHRLPPAPWAHQGSFTRSSSTFPCLPTAPSFVRNRERQTNAFHCVRQASVRVRDKGPRGKGTRCRDLRARGPIFCLCPDCPSAQSSPWRAWRDVHVSHLDLSRLSWQRNQLIIPWQGLKAVRPTRRWPSATALSGWNDA